MKPLRAGARLLLLTAALSAAPLAWPAGPGGQGGVGLLRTARAAEIEWAAGFDAAMEQARTEEKFVMVDFYTHWCYWCKVLDAKTYSDSAVAEISRRLVNVKVNAEAEAQLAQTYGVRAYPTIVFLNPDGSLRQRLQGFQPPQAMRPIIESVLSTESEVAALSNQVQSNPQDEGLRLSLARALALSGSYRRAASELDTLLERTSAAGEERESLELDRWINLHRAGENKRARKGLERWIKRAKQHPRLWEGRYFLALAKEAEGKEKDARKLFTRIAEERRGSWLAEDSRRHLAALR